LLTVALAIFATPPCTAKKWLKDAIKSATKKEAARQAGRAVTGAIRCAVGETECFNEAKKRGEEVVFVDDDGEVITDEQGEPVTDPGNLPPKYQQSKSSGDSATPPTLNANYDFEAGNRILLYDDYSNDNVGDFPRGFELAEGSWEIVDYGETRFLRALSGGMIRIPLPEVLPEQFTIEFPVSVDHGNGYVRLTTGRAFYGRPRDYSGTAITVEHSRAGLRAVGDGPHVLAPVGHNYRTDGVTTFRAMADGNYIKVYLGDQRVAQAPNAIFPRSSELFLAVGSASAQSPILIGPMRIAAGGRDLYDALATDGRVAVHDILFDTDQATIKPESAKVLTEIGTMLGEHPDMSLMIEGHTDATGDFDHNMELSRHRSESVKQWLLTNHGIETNRLRTMGLGSTQPKISGDSDEARRQNRRVELVKIST
jgi:outer membrane protein OmpA-like peptidoglycan-associated protein